MFSDAAGAHLDNVPTLTNTRKISLSSRRQGRQQRNKSLAGADDELLSKMMMQRQRMGAVTSTLRSGVSALIAMGAMGGGRAGGAGSETSDQGGSEAASAPRHHESITEEPELEEMAEAEAEAEADAARKIAAMASARAQLSKRSKRRSQR